MKDKGLTGRKAVITDVGFQHKEREAGIVFYLKLDEMEITFPLDEGKESKGYEFANNLLNTMKATKSSELIGKQVECNFENDRLIKLSVNHPGGGFSLLSVPFYF